MAEPLLTAAQVAAELSVTRKTVYAWLDAGALLGVRLPGGHWRLRRSQIDEFLCRAQSSPAPTTSSESAEPSGSSRGLTPIRVARDPFQRGREMSAKRKPGETNG